MSTTRRIRGENRFYNPPAIRKLQQEREKKRLEEQEAQEKNKAKEITLDRQKKEEEKRPLPSPDECSTSDDCSVPGRVGSNLGRFLDCTTPVVRTQYLPLTSTKGWRTRGPEFCSYFLLNDLWDSFEEWSAYGVGVPLLLNGIDSVVQYYVPYLSGIQLYEDPSRRASASSRKRAGEESDGDSPRDMSSNGCRVSLEEDKPCVGSSSDESEDSPGDLVFEYLEAAMPFGREPLTDKILNLSSQFPALRTYRSCDLSPSSWVSVAWYPIYRIPLGQSLQNLDACFLTFHSLSTPSRGTSSNENGQSSSKSVAPSKKLTLPTFGLASYKFKMSVWSRESDVEENQRVVALLREAEEWLRRLKVMLPDFRHFVTHSGGSAWR
ncbi:hypothetical protein Bca4012_079744 [Brassica carinata]|uniref:Uncharacterized protein n=2 Tax=Brassica TaxID=3705 RepID=A0A0D3DEC0_BRAOL|nr:PREDICTED: uncharacterized protein LOC106303667 [Brassica oleracea var. oleracea]KAG2263860.1 hypothetical protein Bca52824_070939 [Brassica carinata]